MARKIQVKRGAKANIPVLDQGEFGFTTDSGAEELYIGNGNKNIQIARQDSLDSHASRHASGGADPITPSMIGAFGQLDVWTGTDLNEFLSFGAVLISANKTNLPPNASPYGTVWNVSGQDSHYLVQNFFDAAVRKLYWRAYVDGVWYDWNDYATTDYALARDGSNSASIIYLRKVENVGQGFIHKSHDASNDWGTAIEDYAPNGNTAVFIVNANQQEFNAVLNGTTFNLLHTGTKPSGSYTGNGDATARTIDVGGIGGAVALWSGEWGYGVIYPVGGIIANMNGAKYFGGAEVAYVNGMLTLKSTDNLLNANGITYYYQVL